MLFTKKGNRKLRTFFKDMTEGRMRYNNISQATYNEFGNNMITQITITRKPVASAIENILDTFGNDAYENLYHLALNLTLDNGVNIIAEKNEALNIQRGQVSGANVQTMPVPNFTPVLLKDFFDKTQQLMGTKAFFIYTVINNCQSFALACLHANVINIPEVDAFVKQDAKAIFRGHKGLRKFSNALVGLASRGQQLLGNGL